MSGTLKLTKAQRDLLELAAQGELEVSHSHPVAHELYALGLLKAGNKITSGFNILFSHAATITPAGRAALTESQETPPQPLKEA